MICSESIRVNINNNIKQKQNNEIINRREEN